MDLRAFDTLTRGAATLPRRESLLALGSAGLAAVLSRPSGAVAKSNQKTCDKQKKKCRQAVQGYCAGAGDPQFCLNAVLPCCATCSVRDGVLCALEAP